MLLLFQSATEMWLGSKKENEQVCTFIAAAIQLIFINKIFCVISL